MQKFFLGLISLGLLAVISAPSGRAVVLITEHKITPATLTVARGTRVIWINASRAQHWPASDPHPAHTGYGGKGCIGSALDACRPMHKGDRYTFNFDQTGQWSLHDHLNPSLGQEVEVMTEAPSRLTTAKIALSKVWLRMTLGVPSGTAFTNLDEEMRKEVVKRMVKANPAVAWQFLKDTYIVNGQATSNQHNLAHYLGNEIYQEEGIGGLRFCDGSFSFGCFHGVTERALQSKGDLVEEIATACYQNSGGKYDVNVSNCLHGLGHGLTSTQQFQLVPALEGCRRLEKQVRHDCFNGAFMEFAQGSPSVPITVEDPWRLCKELGEEVAWECGWYSMDMLHYRLNLQADTRVGICANAPSQKTLQACHGSYGVWFAMAGEKPESIIAACAKAISEAGRNACLLEAASSLSFGRTANWRENSLIICSAMKGEPAEECRQRTQTMDV